MNKVLQISGTMNLGGQETFIMNLYRKMDFNKIQFDFIVNGEKEGFYEEEIRKLGGTIYHITPMSKNFIKHFLELRKIIKSNDYIAVHRHSSSAIAFIDLLAARSCGIKKTIFHSHTTNLNSKKLFHFFGKIFVNKVSRYRFACSEEAGKFMFDNFDFKIIPNGIDSSKFSYSIKKRKEIRKQLHIPNDAFVVGHVGRFVYAKNHQYIMKIFNEVYQKMGNNAYLLLVGDGVLKERIISDNSSKEFFKNVIILSNRNDIDVLLSGMDIFVFPSNYEGLPVSLIEAQASCLPIIMSNNISNYAIIDSQLVKKLNIGDSNLNEWVDYIIQSKKIKKVRKNNAINESCFNIEKVAEMLTEVYLEYEK